MVRPYFNASIIELEEILERDPSQSQLQLVADELQYRSTSRAQTLLQKLGTRADASLDKSYSKEKITGHQPQPNAEVEPKMSLIDLEKYYSTPAVDINKPELARLSSWIALEALSPQTFKKPEDLAFGDKHKVARLGPTLPWVKGERSKKDYKLFYEIELGSINMDLASQSLIEVFGADEERERPKKESALIGTILVDKNGIPVEEDGICVSSFAWALPLCLSKRLNVLHNWPQIELEIYESIRKTIQRTDEDGQALPIDLVTISHVHNWLMKLFGLKPEMVSSPDFAIRKYHYFKNSGAPETALLNSFFLEDLADTISKAQTGSLGAGIDKYLKGQSPKSSIDLLKDDAALEHAVAPSKMPQSRWPMGTDRSLVLLQQAAVNTITEEMAVNSGIASVNGPPGTGKTTLLRDIISNAIVERASAMANFNDPLKAFSATGTKVPSGGNGFWHIYALDLSMKGHEILVASSNNAAVENISRELPELDAVARSEASYFRFVSDCIARSSDESIENKPTSEPPHQTWGLIAAALGNSKNRGKFQNAFWWDKNASMRLYLKAAKGDDVTEEIRDPKTNKIIERRIPNIITQENIPSPAQAQKNWKSAQSKFNDLKSEVDEKLSEIEKVRQLCLKLNKQLDHVDKCKQQVCCTGKNLSKLMPETHRFKDLWSDVERDFEQNIGTLFDDKKAKPTWYHRLFRLTQGRLWFQLKQQYDQWKFQSERTHRLKLEINHKRAEHGDHFIDPSFYNSPHQTKQILTPWASETLHHKREDLFLAALDVHKAFIDVSAQKMLHNLSVLMGMFSSGGFGDPKKQAHLPDLWSSLFLVVPVISTAFASVNRMLKGMPPESIGWLLIDEAGQAVPQAAVGAIMRAKRSVVVGDPIQIQPVVTLPQRLVDETCRYFNVDPDVWAGPSASAQTLADQVSTYQSEFETDIGPRAVGIPLLVHRRCEDPMFSISNEVAYNNFMVSQVKATDGGDIRKVLGPSSWISVDGDTKTKWCVDEGMKVIEMLRKLHGAGIQKPDIFIISPFRVVAFEMRKLLMKEAALLTSLGLDARDFAYHSVGTVHTVQGREADTVIMLLGAPMSTQDGARRWAGTPENLLNVAVSRAKRNLYVVGSHGAWAGAGSFSVMAKNLITKKTHQKIPYGYSY